ncbi:probable coclaurine N-methyltransferase [Cyanidioschyzon merolae strain 10D]|jgi:cyclopropane-fatty-acyl-phospholipid synthase|uniref:Probable coclaurine N-methyltransferase n=1 Tax=Cyanidioschyzon merolae (strain NIES-3377 / 10D) TaxID=280699 RepID=M1UUW4_CYAM1|nr:probable coclaurine N-methyltransferase [Cyanidioschyzon merolae strain 10D]BAM81691.1 probable coclaurine N-methyltransferase [Cyanidioschyzon merolae strain 10D]|eukprot:XP_005537727.1 probable coclaurine N-methyltransferase [Cyanidioschyzon merolae strain 10D]
MLLSVAQRLLERNLLPDWVIRAGIRKLLRERLAELYSPLPGVRPGSEPETSLVTIIADKEELFLEDLHRRSSIAEHTTAANEQHYEVPSAFFELVLGPRLKYSCGYFACRGTGSLAEAEEAMLALTCERAELADGQYVMDLGCGWGSLSLYLAERYPNMRIVAVSNSKSQRAFIENRLESAGWTTKGESNPRIQVLTADINDWDGPSNVSAGAAFDRIVSVEMFEHMKQYDRLLAKIAGWLKPDGQGKLFIHIFVHRAVPYHFEATSEADWMARYFFTGGTMPSDRLLYRFQEHLLLERKWSVNGMHYANTAEHWLSNMDRNREAVRKLFRQVYGSEREAIRWEAYWRTFFMACAELWSYQGGDEWFVAHYRFRTRLCSR